MRENSNYGEMEAIMLEIELASRVNGTQRRELYGWAQFKAHYLKSATYLDVGTNMGNSAIVMASAIKHQNLDIPATVHTVDNYCESSDPAMSIEVARRNMSCFGLEDILSIHVADDLEFINSLPDESVDMVFDDSGHSYLRTLSRLRAYVPKMKKNSIITGHDYYVDDASIVKAVHDFMREFPDQLIGLHIVIGMFCIFCKVDV